tara:strand:- start:737 stop:1051 length:315 start_codon:yes stop_codon:yes gene_type:complete
MSPKTVGAYTKFPISKVIVNDRSRAVFRGGFVAILANASYQEALNGGDSTSQPTGILNTSGTGSAAGGTHELAPTLDHIFDLKKDDAIDKADAVSATYVINEKF